MELQVPPSTPVATPTQAGPDAWQEILSRPGATRASGDREPAPDGRRRHPFRVVALLAAGYLALGLVWALSNPAPSGTDEGAHYIKALATARGELTGPHVPYPYRGMRIFPGILDYWDQSTIAFRVPARQAPAATGQCDDGTITGPTTCVEGTRCQRWVAPCTGSPPVTGDVVLATYVGNYVPTFYVVPGLLAQLGNDDVNGLRLARIGALLVALLLVTLAALLLVDGRSPALSLVGLVVSVTPTALYLNSVLNPNGAEIAASICFTAAMLRLWRDGGGSPRWVWLAAGASGALLGFSRLYGPLWIAAAAGTAVLLIGVRSSLDALRRTGWPALVAVGLTAAGVLADLAWWLAVGVPRARTSLLAFPRYLFPYLSDLPHLFEQQIGYFGWMDIPLGTFGWLTWSVMTLSVLVLALLVATAGQRALLWLLIAGDLLVTVVLASIMRVSWDFPGVGVVGRYFLPGTVVVTLLSGEILRRNASRLGALMPRNLLVYVTLAATVCQGNAIWMAARRFAVGLDGRLFFLPVSQWSPPLGWVPWLLLTGLGCLLVVGAAMLGTRTATVDPEPATG